VTIGRIINNNKLHKDYIKIQNNLKIKEKAKFYVNHNKLIIIQTHNF